MKVPSRPRCAMFIHIGLMVHLSGSVFVWVSS